MSEKKAVGPTYPTAAPQAPPTFVPAPPQPANAAQQAYGVYWKDNPVHVVPGGAPYGVFPSQAAAAQLYAAQGPPPTYDQALAHPAIMGQQMYPPATMYAAAAAAGYPAAAGYLGYPTAYTPMQYYPSLAYSYPMQPTQLRPTIMIPNGFDAGTRFDGIAQPVIPPAPPGVPPSAAQLAAMAGHQVAMSQKKGSFLAGGSEGGYTFW